MFSLMFPLVNELVLLAREQVLVMQLVELGHSVYGGKSKIEIPLMR